MVTMPVVRNVKLKDQPRAVAKQEQKVNAIALQVSTLEELIARKVKVRLTAMDGSAVYVGIVLHYDKFNILVQLVNNRRVLFFKHGIVGLEFEV